MTQREAKRTRVRVVGLGSPGAGPGPGAGDPSGAKGLGTRPPSRVGAGGAPVAACSVSDERRVIVGENARAV
jgi:hypothetical protein